MNILDRCLQFLDSAGVVYSHSVHSPATSALGVADRDRVSPREVAKTVLYVGDKGYGLAVCRADRDLDLFWVRQSLGLNSVRIATELELELVIPGSEHGALPPLGNLFNLPVLADEGLVTQPYIAFSAGTSRDVIRMATIDFLQIVQPTISRFATVSAAAG